MAGKAAPDRFDITLPAGFDPRKHLAGLERQVNARYEGADYIVTNVNLGKLTATAERVRAVSEVSRDEKTDALVVDLVKTTKKTDGEKIAAQYEAQNPGYTLTDFDPHRFKARLTQLDAKTVRARDALATALGVKPWDVKIRPSADGGYDVILPPTYMPSKHDDKLQEIVETAIGEEGWFIRVNSKTLRAKIIPADPPTFPGSIPYPFGAHVEPFDLRKGLAPIPIGVQLGVHDKDGDVQYLDLESSPHTQMSGTSGSGKTVTINATIFGALARGAELVIADLPSKSVDFEWAKPFVRRGGWGCESLRENVAALALVYEEGERRAKELKRLGVTKWTEAPASSGMRPIYVVTDEVTGLFFPDEVPKGIDKESLLFLEPTQNNMLKAMLKAYISKIAAEHRFVGTKLLLSSQVASTNTGIPTSIRLNLGNKMLMGTKPTDNNRKLALSDANRVPKVPDNIASDKFASRGVGVTEFEAQEPAVFKSFYASVEDFAKHLDQLGIIGTNEPRPAPEDLDRLVPVQDFSLAKSEQEGFGRGGRELEDWEIDPETGRPLSGRQRANAARHQLAQG